MDAQRRARSRGNRVTGLVPKRTKSGNNEAARKDLMFSRAQDDRGPYRPRGRNSLEGAIGSRPFDPLKEMHHAETLNLWQKVHAEFGLLNVEQLAAKMSPKDYKKGLSVSGKAIKDGNLLGVFFDGEPYFPQFQIEGGLPRPVIAELNKLRKESNASKASLLLWMVSPTTWWSEDGDRPVDHLENEDEVLAAYKASMVIPW